MFQLICNLKLYAIMQCCIKVKHWFAELIGFKKDFQDTIFEFLKTFKTRLTSDF